MINDLPTEPCIFCGKPILETSVKCKHCGEFLLDDNKKKIKEKPRVFFSGGKSHEYAAKKKTSNIIYVIWWGVIGISLLLFNYGGELFNNESKKNSKWQTKEKTTCITAGTITTCTTKEPNND